MKNLVYTHPTEKQCNYSAADDVDQVLQDTGLPIHDVRTYPIRDGYSITAGDVVNADVGGSSSETVYRDVEVQANITRELNNQRTASTATILLNEKYMLVAMAEYNDSIHLMLLNVTDGSFVSEANLGCDYRPSSLSLAKLDDTHIAMAWIEDGGSRGMIVTISGTDILFPGISAYDFDPRFVSGDNICVLAQLDRVTYGDLPCRIYIYSDGGNNGLLFHLSIVNSSGNKLQFLPSITKAYDISADFISNDSSGNQRICVSFSDGNDNYKNKAVIATIDSENNVTFGDIVTFSDNTNTFLQSTLVYSRIDNVVYFLNESYLYILTEDLQELQHMQIFPSKTIECSVSLIPLSCGGVLDINSHPANGACIARWNGESIVYGATYDFKQGATVQHVSGAQLDSNRYGISFVKTDYCNNTILEVSGNQIAGSFIDHSKDAIALESGNAGDNIKVGFGGYCECSGVIKGQTIDSNGVSAYAVQDGWLQIKNALDKGYIFGSVSGYAANRLVELGFRPKVVFIITNLNGANNTVAYTERMNSKTIGGTASSNKVTITITDSGFSLNAVPGAGSGTTFGYVALR